MEKKILLEVIAASVHDAKEAYRGGAERLELCSALALGGLTPTLGTLELIKKEVPIPVMGMIRPREGGMAYDPGEFTTMQRDAELLIEAGAEGLVFGFLTSDAQVDISRCRSFLRVVDSASKGRTVETVFHRAFDVVADSERALEDLIDLGITRVLTSGRTPTAIEGLGEIRRLVEQADQRIQILPGGGITTDHVRPLVKATGVDQIHLYLTEILEDCSVTLNPDICFGAHAPESELEYRRVDANQVHEVRQLLSDWEEPS